MTCIRLITTVAITTALLGAAGCSDSGADTPRNPRDPIIQSNVPENTGFTNRTGNGMIESTGNGNTQDSPGSGTK